MKKLASLQIIECATEVNIQGFPLPELWGEGLDDYFTSKSGRPLYPQGFIKYPLGGRFSLVTSLET